MLALFCQMHTPAKIEGWFGRKTVVLVCQRGTRLLNIERGLEDWCFGFCRVNTSAQLKGGVLG